MARLPPGFRFHPTDTELVMYYLKRKIMGKNLHFDAITELNIYRFSPWDLPDKCSYKSKDLEWYFFCPRERKYSCGFRMNRATETGYWKTTGKDRSIMYEGKVVGSVKTLIFHLGHPPKGQRTDWVIHEYKFEDKGLVEAGFAQDAYVLCRVFQKSGPGPKNGAQYGAPFKEEDWEDEEVPAAPCTSDIFSAPPDNQGHSVVTSAVHPGNTGCPPSELSLSSIQRMEVPEEPNPPIVSSINCVPDELNPSNIFSAQPDKQSCSVGPGSGLFNAQLCTNEMPLDEQDDEIIGLLAHFTEDPSLHSTANENNQNPENFDQDINAPTAPLTGGNDIFDGLGDIYNWAGSGQFYASTADNYRLNPMFLPEDTAYLELNDLETPLYQSAEMMKNGQLVPSNLCAPPYYSNVGVQGNSLGIDLGACDNQLPMLPESYTQQVYHFPNNESWGFDAATVSAIPYKQPADEGVQQRKFVKAEVTLGISRCTNDALAAILGDTFLFICPSSIVKAENFVKAEVTLGIGRCTNDALAAIMGDTFVFICPSSIVKAENFVKAEVTRCTNDALAAIMGDTCQSSIVEAENFVKAEVTFGIGRCTNDALAAILGDPCVFACQSSMVKADIFKENCGDFWFGLVFICFSHLKRLWFNLLWDSYEFIFSMKLPLRVQRLCILLQKASPKCLVSCSSHTHSSFISFPVHKSFEFAMEYFDSTTNLLIHLQILNF